MSEVEKNEITNKLKSVIPSDSITIDTEKRIEELINFTDRLERMEPALKDEFLMIIDDIILNGNIDVIIKENDKVKKKEI